MSNGASFVKRSKPRSSASRINSTYDDDEDAVAGPSSSSIRPTPARGDTSSSASGQDPGTTNPRWTIIGQDDIEDEEDATTSSVVFRARAKGIRGASTSSSPAFASRSVPGRPSVFTPLKQRTTGSAVDEEDAGADGDAFKIRRSTLGLAGKQARKATLGNSSLSTASTDTPRRSTPLRPTSFQDRPSDTAESSSGTPSSVYTSKYLEELRSSTPTSRSRAHSPTPVQQPTGPGTRIDDPMVTQTSRIALQDPADGSLARSKFAADFAHDSIPSESVIRAAKEKRAKLRAAAAASATSTPEDYISLAPFSKSSALKRYDAMEVDDGPHPHSRLQREEDELGDGEDEFAEFTGATERIPIGERAEQEWKDRQRREMEAAVRGDFDQDAVVEDEMNEDEEEWERAQLRRTQTLPHHSTSQPPSREASPFRPAPIPASVPLPSVGTCSTRLELTLRALEQSTAASTAVITSTAKELDTLDAAERENKLDVAAVEDKAGWFNELDEFVASLARFMEEKMVKVEEVEKQALDLLVKRNRILSKRRGRWFDDRLSAMGVTPATNVVVDLGEEQEEQEADTADNGVKTQAVHASQLDILEPADELSFSLAQQDIIQTLTSIFADVQAPEYLDPAATTLTDPGLSFLSAPPPPDAALHPRSIVSRFQDCRRRYPEEYAQVWGGLSIAQIWEFYARLELIPWSPFSASTSNSQWREGATAIAHFRWFTGASDYTSADTVVGGDDEILPTLIANILVSHLINLASKGGFSPWSTKQTEEAVEAVDLVQTVLGVKHARCVSLVDAVLEVFRRQIARLREVVQQSSMGVQMRGGVVAEKVRQEIGEELGKGLLKNLVGWSCVVSLQTDEGGARGVLGKGLVGLVESLVVEVIGPFTGQGESAQVSMRKVFEIVPESIVARSEKLILLSQRQ